MAYRRKQLQYEELKQEPFQPTEPTIYAIEWAGVTFEFLVNWRRRKRSAVVFGTGIVGKRGEVSWPIFSRAMWMRDISGSGIWYFDPTCREGEANLCWYYGHNDRWYLENIAYLIQIILEKMGITREHTLFMGSSGGGYSSIVLATLLRGKALAVNPQTVLENYSKKFVEEMKEVSLLPGETLLPERNDVTALFRREGYCPLLFYRQNLTAEQDLDSHFVPFLHSLAKFLGDTSLWLRVGMYSKEGGHSGMEEKEVTLERIEVALGEPLLGQVVGEAEADSFFVRANTGALIREAEESCSHRRTRTSEGEPAWSEEIADPTISCVAEEERISVSLSGILPMDCQFAFYLLREKEALVKTKYQKNGEYCFSSLEPGTYQIKCFVRRGEEKKVYVTQPITVGPKG